MRDETDETFDCDSRTMTTRSRTSQRGWLLLPIVILLRTMWLVTVVNASEFPERECCDSLPDSGIAAALPTLPVDVWPGLVQPSATSTEVVDVAIIDHQHQGATQHTSSQQHPDTNNFLFPEFVPELSLDLGYPMPPPLHPYHYTPDAGNNVPTTTGTGKLINPWPTDQKQTSRNRFEPNDHRCCWSC